MIKISLMHNIVGLFSILLIDSAFGKVYNEKSYSVEIEKDKVYMTNMDTGTRKRVKLDLSKGVLMPKVKQDEKGKLITENGERLKKSGKVTSKDYLRDKNHFWKEYAKKYPKELSTRNKSRIKEGKSPVVDSKWEKTHREHKAFRGQTLEHHHMGHGVYAVPLPEKLHRGKKNNQLFHDTTKQQSEIQKHKKKKWRKK